MKKITSFTVDHNTLEKGIYISRIDGDITTYDMRFIKPNTPPFLPNPVMHTIEHLFATYSRNSEYADNVIYFGPMGCRTGFYFLVKDLDNQTALDLIKETLKKCIDHKGDIPGNTAIECGNYLEHDVEGANEALKKYFEIIKDYKVEQLDYNYCK
ncbi:MAG: S-ribosylhomocysteine lyase [Oscillospiraceae bacterium]|nr:S-ribosylhomocysteine lyase [Oscillospiraceae bacterium]